MVGDRRGRYIGKPGSRRHIAVPMSGWQTDGRGQAGAGYQGVRLQEEDVASPRGQESGAEGGRRWRDLHVESEDTIWQGTGKWAGIYTEELTRWLDNSPGEGNGVIAGQRGVVALEMT